VLELLRDGLGTEAVATRLGVSPITARRRAAKLEAKLGVRGRTNAISVAERLSAAPRSRRRGVV